MMIESEAVPQFVANNGKCSISRRFELGPRNGKE